MINPLSFSLSKLEWQLYVTLTFGANWSKRKTRNKLERIFAWLRRIVHYHTGDKSLDLIPFVCAEELGELNERYHVHILLGGLPRKFTKTDCFAMQWLWKEEFRGGFAKIRPYAPSLRGVGYVLKSLSLSDLRSISSESGRERAQALAGVHVGNSTTYAGANAFEVGKIGSQDMERCMVMVSHGCHGLLVRRANSSRNSAKSVEFFRRGSKRQATANTIDKTARAARSGAGS